MLADDGTGGLILTTQSRALKRNLGPTAWAVLEDVLLDAIRQDGRWLAKTTTRLIGDHLGLMPGTVARALARLGTEGIVRREDRRDAVTGRFGEAVYVVQPLAALRPCIAFPHTDRRDTETPAAVQRDSESPHEVLPGEEERQPEQVPDRAPGSSRRPPRPEPMQQLLLGNDVNGTTSAVGKPSTPTANAQDPEPQSPSTHRRERDTPYSTQGLISTTQRPTDTCQLSEQALPGRASC